MVTAQSHGGGGGGNSSTLPPIDRRAAERESIMDPISGIIYIYRMLYNYVVYMCVISVFKIKLDNLNLSDILERNERHDVIGEWEGSCYQCDRRVGGVVLSM